MRVIAAAAVVILAGGDRPLPSTLGHSHTTTTASPVDHHR